MATRIVIVGGSDAGIAAAMRARRRDPASEITVVLRDRFPGYSVCGLPYFLGGEVSEPERLAHHSPEELHRLRLELVCEAEVDVMDPRARVVEVKRGGATSALPFDRALLATGARARTPDVPGADLEGVHVLRSMGDGLRLREHADALAPSSAVLVVGGGYIGVEAVEAFVTRGFEVTLVERHAVLGRTLDPAIASLVERELSERGVRVRTGARVAEVARAADGRLRATGEPDLDVAADLVLLATGVEPETWLARAAGLEVDAHGAVVVDRSMATRVPGVYAAGDCAQTWLRHSDRAGYLPLGSTAHKQGRVAGENLAGGAAVFAGSLGTQVVKIFDVVAAATGLSEADATREGFDVLAVDAIAPDRNWYYPGSSCVAVRVVGDRSTGRLLGAQIFGHVTAEVAKRIDVFAAALFERLPVGRVAEFDLSYSPPFGTPWDAVQVAALAWSDAAGFPG
jgi:NADPH-dependent 2,4-dienoyl-CoA reductase/sulfur reductase-like enzyme